MPKSLRPWIKSSLIEIKKSADGRYLLWYHEPAGGSGKSKGLVLLLIKEFDALQIDVTASNVNLAAIKSHYEKSELFRMHPIIICNIPRGKSREASKEKVYTVLEEIMDSFIDKKSGRQHVWVNDIYPHVIVTANVPPVAGFMVGRIKTFFINEKYELMPDTLTQKELDRANGKES